MTCAPPLNNIKGAIYYLQRQSPSGSDPGDKREFYEIIDGK